jgi:AraC family transcriptional regulator
MHFEIKQMPELRVATVSHNGPYERISDAFVRLNEIVQSAGLADAALGLIGIYHDDPKSRPASELRADAGVIVPAGTELPKELKERRLRAGRYAQVIHLGAYEQLGGLWSRFRTEVFRTGHRVAAEPNYEIYRNTPGEVSKEKLETELYIPLD